MEVTQRRESSPKEIASADFPVRWVAPADKAKGCREQFHITVDCKRHQSATEGHPFLAAHLPLYRYQTRCQNNLFQQGLVLPGAWLPLPTAQ